MAIPGNVGMRKSTFSSPAAMAQAQRAADAQSMKALQNRREQTRQDFFKGRPDISDNRLDRRQIQKDLYEQFKNDPTKTKLVGGTTNLYQAAQPGGPTLADEAMRLANMYGPTFREIGSDIGYAVGSMGKGLGQFIGKGGVIGNVLSGLYDKFKGGTQQGIETVKGLYDNLRTTLSGQPTVTYGGGSTMVTTSDGQPRVDLTPTSIATETLPSMNLSRNVGDESDPSIFGITNTGVPLPFLRSTADLPYNNISSFNPDVYQPGYLPESFSNVGVVPIVPEYSTPVPQGIQDLTPGSGAEYFLLSELRDNTPPNQQFEGNYTLPKDHPVNLANRIMFYPKDGGSIDKYAGLGYKLK